MYKTIKTSEKAQQSNTAVLFIIHKKFKKDFSFHLKSDRIYDILKVSVKTGSAAKIKQDLR